MRNFAMDEPVTNLEQEAHAAAVDAPNGEVVGAMEQSITDDSLSIQQKLDAARRELLDLTLRNRLINTRRRTTRTNSIEVLDEKSSEVFRILVGDGKEMSFDARVEREKKNNSQVVSDTPGGEHGCDDWPCGDTKANEEEENQEESDFALIQPEDDEVHSDGVAARHRDNRLQTAMTSEKLQTRLLRMYYDARTAIEEQGVNILFLALGFLKWYEADDAGTERFAPLVLVPVELNRKSARSRFVIRFAEDDITTNLSLKEKLKVDFGIELPDLPEVDAKELDVSAYFAAAREAIAGFSRWEILEDDVVLGFFSFAKLLMYRDLDAANWPGDEKNILEQILVKKLFEDGFIDEPPLAGEDELIDPLLPPATTRHIVDADSSQSLAIEEVRRGRNLVIQGPPGTGKSQTITNVIAAAVADGKRVLFLAEKLAALEVVKRRLTNVGLGDMCLELHSNKARKKEVLQEIGRTLELGPPKTGNVEQTAEQLQANRDRLNAHCALMHRRFEPSGCTPYETIGALVRLQQQGVSRADFQLRDAARWTPDDMRRRRELLQTVVQHVEVIGWPAEHPWRGVLLESSIPADRDRLLGELPAAQTKVRRLIECIDAIQKILFCSTQHRLKDAARLHAFATAMLEAPREMDAAALENDVWDKHRDDISRVVENGNIYATRRAELDNVVVDAAWSFDPAESRRDMAAWGGSLLRFLNGPYRRSKAALRGILKGNMPKSLNERLAIFDKLIEARAAKAVVEARDDVGRNAFGTLWRGADSDFVALKAIDLWEKKCRENPAVPDGFRRVMRKIADRDALAQATKEIAGAMADCRGALTQIIERIKLDIKVAFASNASSASAPETIDDILLPNWEQRMDMWRANPEGLSKWIGYQAHDTKLRALECGALCDRLYDGRITPESARDIFETARCEAVIRQMMVEPGLQSFDGLSHEQVLQRFREFDLQRIDLARREVARAHYESIPRGGAGIGELGIIRHEIAKKTRHIPIRKLLAGAGNAITRIKPVMMMSPMSIAQYVEPGALEFDILVIDEASQVRPVDALGAAARAAQFVVVGDDKQLPPTRFFNRMLDDAPDEEETIDDLAVRDLESVLGLCRSRGMADRMLRWHYRSRHHSLIAVSNREFYEHKLYVIPSPARRDREHGVVFHHLPEAIYDRSASRTNHDEARAVAEAVMRHAAETPGLSLGVGAFSVAQRDAILDEVERMRRGRPELEKFFAPGSIEPFFVKNLENIQGDERDVIYISVGYGRDSSGYMSMNFGPLSSDGGERRLNVLITRAKTRCEIFSSITDDDIDLNRVSGFGPRALKTYLSFARTGQVGVASASGRDHDSDFEAAVAGALRGAGYQVDNQIDESGFFIDLAVADPDQPGRYLLGIECDGASYHSARSARDRDRIRQAVLEDRGWRIHRIWSTDWFHRPQDELRKVIDRIEAAREDIKAATETARNAAVEPATRPMHDVIAREDMAEEVDDLSQPYVEASFAVPQNIAIPDLSLAKLANVIEKIVKIEGPIHPDEIAQRVTDLWGVRSGSRIDRAISSAITAAAQSGNVRMLDDGFVVAAANNEIVVRNRGNVSSATLRRVEMLPPSEIDECLNLLLQRHIGASREELIPSTARQFGYRTTSAQLREFINGRIDAMVGDGRVLENAGRLRCAESV